VSTEVKQSHQLLGPGFFTSLPGAIPKDLAHTGRNKQLCHFLMTPSKNSWSICWFTKCFGGMVWRNLFRHIWLGYEARKKTYPGLQCSLQVFVETHIPQQLPCLLRNLRAQVWSSIFVLHFERCREVSKSDLFDVYRYNIICNMLICIASCCMYSTCLYNYNMYTSYFELFTCIYKQYNFGRWISGMTQGNILVPLI